MRGDVRLYAGVPPVTAFGGPRGSPIVIDTTTGVAYFLNGSTVQAIGGGDAGTFTMVGTGVTNASGVVVDNPTNYIRNGSQVIVAGRVDFTAGAAGAFVVSLSLPIASNIVGSTDVHGVGANGTQPAGVAGYPTTSRAQLLGAAPGAIGLTFWFTFMYTIK